MKLEVKAVSKSFNDINIIKDISLDVLDGEIVCLIGASGVGKTTLFNIISGLLKPDSGDVFIDGKSIIGKTGNISYMLQKDMLLPHLTVLDNVSLPLLIKKEKKTNAHKIALSYFKRFGLKGCENKYPNEISGGMRQRAAFLRTYLFSGKVALLDEPFSALDAITKGDMHGWYLSVMKKIKLSTLFITHDIDEAILLSNRVYIMKGDPGKIVEQINIEYNNERDVNFTLSSLFAKYKRQILKKL